MNIYQIINVAMFVVVGAVLAYVDCGILERPFVFMTVMVAMVVLSVTTRISL
jgi:hypothetical protein